MSIIIRKANQEDIPALAKIKVDGWKDAYQGIVDEDFLESLTYDTQINRFNDGEDSPCGIVAIDEKKGEVVGFSTFGKRKDLSKGFPKYDCELHSIYISSDRKGEGIGRKLLKEVLKQQKVSGYNKMLLWCFKENIDTIEFYKRTGGVLLGEKEIEIEKMRFVQIGFGYEL